MSITVLCPTRGNPAALLETYLSFRDTVMDPTTTFIAVIDWDDPDLQGYLSLCEDAPLQVDIVMKGQSGNMNLALNWAASNLVNRPGVNVVGFVGDDHRFRTKGWDRVIAQVLADNGGGFVYANDLLQGEQLPTQVFISADIVRALGWMGLPGARHLYLDNTWKMLGDGADCLYYLPDVVIEHLHPASGKVQWDDNHRRVNTSEMYQHDAAVYERWLKEQADADIKTVQSVLF